MRRGRRKFARPEPKLRLARVNKQITAPEVRVIDPEGKQVGVLSTLQAIKLAEERDVDLIEVSPKAVPPVCKLISFDKYRYQVMKEAREGRKRQKTIEVKGVRLSIRISDHDFDFKRKQALKFFSQGNKVKVEVRLRGREKAHVDLAKKLLSRFREELGVPTKLEQDFEMGHIGVSIIIAKQ